MIGKLLQFQPELHQRSSIYLPSFKLQYIPEGDYNIVVEMSATSVDLLCCNVSWNCRNFAIVNSRKILYQY